MDHQHRRARPEVAPLDDDRGSKILGGLNRRGDGRRAVAIALASTALVFVALGFAVANSPGWPQLHQAFFNGHRFASDFPGIASTPSSST